MGSEMCIRDRSSALSALVAFGAWPNSCGILACGGAAGPGACWGGGISAAVLVFTKPAGGPASGDGGMLMKTAWPAGGSATCLLYTCDAAAE